MHLLTNAFVICVSVVATSSESCTNRAQKPELMNKELTTQTMAMYYNCQSSYKCALKCVVRHGCLSMSYNWKEQTCLIHRVNSLSVSTEEFLTVPGSAYSDLEDWPLSHHPCHNNTCADGKQCFPNENLYVCIKTESCLENPMSLNCYKRYPNDLRGNNVSKVKNVKATVEDCIIFCNTVHPTYASILYAADKSCWCKKVSVRAYLEAGKKLALNPGTYVYEKLWLTY